MKHSKLLNINQKNTQVFMLDSRVYKTRNITEKGGITLLLFRCTEFWIEKHTTIYLR
jgi:hypothetical protein